MKRNELAVTPTDRHDRQRAPTPVGSRDIHPCWHSHRHGAPMVRAAAPGGSDCQALIGPCRPEVVARQGLIARLLIGPCRRIVAGRARLNSSKCVSGRIASPDGVALPASTASWASRRVAAARSPSTRSVRRPSERSWPPRRCLLAPILASKVVCVGKNAIIADGWPAAGEPSDIPQAQRDHRSEYANSIACNASPVRARVTGVVIRPGVQRMSRPPRPSTISRLHHRQ